MQDRLITLVWLSTREGSLGATCSQLVLEGSYCFENIDCDEPEEVGDYSRSLLETHSSLNDLALEEGAVEVKMVVVSTYRSLEYVTSKLLEEDDIVLELGGEVSHSSGKLFVQL